MESTTNNKWLLARAMIALPCLIVVALLTPNLDAEDFARFPVEQLAVPQLPANIDEALKAPEDAWSTANNGPYAGFRSSTNQVWRRIKIPASPTGKAERLVAAAELLFLPEVDFYLVEDGRIINSVQTGMDRLNQRGESYSARYKIVFDQHHSRPRVIYARLGAEFLFLAPLVVRTEDRHQHIGWLQDLVSGLFFGAILGLLLYNLALSLHLNQVTYRHYAVYLACTLTLAFVLNSTALDVLSITGFNFGRWMQVMLAACYLIIAGYLNFSRSFLRLSVNYPKIDRLAQVGTGAALAAVLMSMFVPFAWSGLILVLSVILISFVTILICLPKLNVPEVFTFFVAVAGIVFGAVVQGVLAPFTLGTILKADGIFLLGSLWAALFLSIAIARQLANVNDQHEKIQAALSHEAPMTAINAYLDDSFGDQFNAVEMTVTIMFIDMASFSRMAEMVDAETMLVETSRRLEQITSIVQKHQGTIDRSLGDGVLCFFGYDRNSLRGEQHVKQAYLAALDIQRAYLADIKQSFERGESRVPLPVRIGIHTDKVTIGNMGTTAQIDFTMVGNGVNFANRLETACGPYRIMVSAASREALIAAGVDAKTFDPTMIAVKHQLDLVPAYEINPHVANMEQLTNLNRHFLDLMGEKMRHPRQGFRAVGRVVMSSVYGKFQLKDFSPQGFLLIGDAYLAQKAILSLSIDTGDSASNQLLIDHGLVGIEVEIRWSRKIGNSYHHGVQVIGGHRGQWDYLYELLIKINKDHEELVA